ncbi:MAG: VPA1267 family protein [Solirubrobacteraceae bacterium]
MAGSGQEIARENAKKFDRWVLERCAAEDWSAYIRANKLNRSEIARECGFAKAVFGQNPVIKAALARVEGDLARRQILRAEAPSGPPPQRAEAAADRLKQRLNQLEQRNQTLRAENDALKALLKRYRLLDEYLLDSGRLPR